jgi:hypothetical protein
MYAVVARCVYEGIVGGLATDQRNICRALYGAHGMLRDAMCYRYLGALISADPDDVENFFKLMKLHTSSKKPRL